MRYVCVKKKKTKKKKQMMMEKCTSGRIAIPRANDETRLASTVARARAREGDTNPKHKYDYKK